MLTLVPNLQIWPRKYSAGKYARHSFGKSERSWWDSKQNEWLSRSNRSNGFYKTVVLKNFPKFTRKHLCWSLFFDNVRLCRSATSFKRRLQHRFSFRILQNLLVQYTSANSNAAYFELSLFQQIFKSLEFALRNSYVLCCLIRTPIIRTFC